MGNLIRWEATPLKVQPCLTTMLRTVRQLQHQRCAPSLDTYSMRERDAGRIPSKFPSIHTIPSLSIICRAVMRFHSYHGHYEIARVANGADEARFAPT